MKHALFFAGILLCFFSGPRFAVAMDRTRTTWQEGCQERQVQVLDKCQLSHLEQSWPRWRSRTSMDVGAAQ